MLTLDEIMKAKDSSGHEHGANGQFTSGSGAKYEVKDDTGKDDALGHYTREVHGPSGKIGEVKMRNPRKGDKYVRHHAVHTAGGAADAMATGISKATSKDANKTQNELIGKLIEHHESKGSPNVPIPDYKPADAEKLDDAADRNMASVQDAYRAGKVPPEALDVAKAQQHEAIVAVLGARERHPEEQMPYEEDVQPVAEEEPDNQLGFLFKERGMSTLAEIMKDGTAHDPKTGQFTAGNGYVGTMKSSSGKKYGIKTEKKKLAHTDRFTMEPKKTMHSLYHVHDDEGNHIGHVDKYQTAKYSHERRAYAHDGTSLGGSKVAHGNEELDRERLHGLLRAVTDHHESKQKEKSMTLGDIMKSHRPFTLEAIMKADAMPLVADSQKIDPTGSFEDLLNRIKVPVILGSGCSQKPKYLASGERDYGSADNAVRSPHWVGVESTFPGYAYVKCSDEDRIWKVPYIVNADGTITTGTAEEHVSVFVPLDAADTVTEDVADGGALGTSNISPV